MAPLEFALHAPQSALLRGQIKAKLVDSIASLETDDAWVREMKVVESADFLRLSQPMDLPDDGA